MIHPCRERIPAAGNRRVAALLHEIGGVFAPVVKRLLPPRKREGRLSDRSDIRKILVVRLDGMGDLVMSSPMFPALKRAFPRATVTLLAANWSRCLVPLMDGIDDVRYFDAPWVTGGGIPAWWRLIGEVQQLRSEGYDLGIDPRGDFRNNLLLYLMGIPHRVGFAITGGDYWLTDVIPAGSDRHIRSFARTAVTYLAPDLDPGTFMPHIRRSEAGMRSAEAFLAKHGVRVPSTRPIVVIHPAARWPGRQWAIDRYAAVADRLAAAHEAIIILTGSSAEQPITRAVAEHCKIATPIDSAGAVPFEGFLGLLATAALFIGVDSGPMHFADALSTPVVALVGPALARTIRPAGVISQIITRQERFPCSPCPQRECVCKGNSCLDILSIDEVTMAGEKILRRDRFESK